MSLAVESALKRERILWGAPTFDQCRIAWDETYQAAADVAAFHITKMEVEFPGGGTITYRSLDNPDNARGHTADGVIIDEASMVKARAWYEVLRPIISDTGGWALLMATPKGHNWFWREWNRARDDVEAQAWQIPTLGAIITENGLERRPHPLENLTFPWPELQHCYDTMPERVFRQEYLAEFIEDAGGVFRGVRAVADAEPEESAKPGDSYVMGVDWGKYQDFTAILVVNATLRHAIALDRFNKIDYTYQVERLRTLYDAFKPTTIVAERNSMGEPLIEQLQRMGLPIQPFTTTNASKAEAIEALGLAIERQQVHLLDDPQLIAELQAYEATRLPSGMLRYGAPEGMHDDCVMALALAWHALNVSPALQIVRGARLYPVREPDRHRTDSRGLYGSRK